MQIDIVKLCAVIGKVLTSRSGKKISKKHAASIETYFKEQNTTPAIRRASLIYALIKTGESFSEDEKEDGIDACINEMAQVFFNDDGMEEEEECPYPTTNTDKVEDLPMFG